jgi:eukaryotic-like serine/threonine-protein kinase
VLLTADSGAEAQLAHIDQAFSASYSDWSGSEQDEDPLKMVGRTVSHFRVIEALAAGGMGVVYRAEDTQLKRVIALKFPLLAESLDRSAKQRFLHEARVAGGLDHPNLCVIYEAGETDDGHLFYAMPLYKGETLKARLAREGALPLRDALLIAKQIAHGLRAAHDAGIVHRDLKPANVMLLPDGTVKILDFGLAKQRDIDLTQSQMMLGTVSYMAPEQLFGNPFDARTDLWALGVVLYEMLTGVRPFEGRYALEIGHSIAHTDPVEASSARPGIPPELDAVVRTLLRKDPTQRYQSAEQAAAALDSIQIVEDVPPRFAARRNVLARAHRPQTIRAAALALLAIVAVASIAWLATRGTSSTSPLTTVAVLPFDDSTHSESNHYLADGLSDAIRTELSRIRAVVVPSHLSSLRYQGTAKPLSQVASELGASAVVKGTVRRAGDRVRVDVQLLDSKTGRQLWTRQYEPFRTATADIQRDAAKTILAKLGVDATDAERRRLERSATNNARAYDLYLRGRYLELSGAPRVMGYRRSVENMRAAQALYSQARTLDPEFAVARARLAVTHMFSAGTYDTTEARRDQARLEAETALRLQPDLFEAHEALSAYWNRRGDLPKAIEELEVGLKSTPNHVGMLLSLGQLYSTAGRWEDAVAQFDRATQLDPRNPYSYWLAATTYLRLRRDEEAMLAFDRLIEVSPDDHQAKVIKGHTYLRWKGTADTLAAALQRVPSNWDPNGMATWARYTVLRTQRKYPEGLSMLNRAPSELSRDGYVYQPKSLMRAEMYHGLGNSQLARAQYEAARRTLADSAAAHPDDPSIHSALGLANAALGRKEEAIREARRAMEIVPVSRDSPGATAFMGLAVEVFARAGEFDPAFELLELLLAMPSGREVTISFLRVWPGFDPLRSDPRFEKLIERFAVK